MDKGQIEEILDNIEDKDEKSRLDSIYNIIHSDFWQEKSVRKYYELVKKVEKRRSELEDKNMFIGFDRFIKVMRDRFDIEYSKDKLIDLYYKLDNYEGLDGYFIQKLEEEEYSYREVFDILRDNIINKVRFYIRDKYYDKYIDGVDLPIKENFIFGYFTKWEGYKGEEVYLWVYYNPEKYKIEYGSLMADDSFIEYLRNEIRGHDDWERFLKESFYNNLNKASDLEILTYYNYIKGDIIKNIKEEEIVDKVLKDVLQI